MKTILMALLVLSPLFANAAKTTTIYGIAKVVSGCAESPLMLVTGKNSSGPCLGFDGVRQEDIAPGRVYGLSGYTTEDGFFAQRIIVDTTTWEIKHPVKKGDACPAQARQNDSVAYDDGGGYSCYSCGLSDSNPLTTSVTEMTKCSTTISCQLGTCQ